MDYKNYTPRECTLFLALLFSVVVHTSMMQPAVDSEILSVFIAFLSVPSALLQMLVIYIPAYLVFQFLEDDTEEKKIPVYKLILVFLGCTAVSFLLFAAR